MYNDQPHRLSGTPQQQTSTAAAPFASSRPTAFGRSLASPHRPQAAAAVLPRPVLQRIFSHLPLSSHSQCALVCRHWHASVPSTTKEVAQWIAQLRPAYLQCSDQMGASYPYRTGPWLRAQRSPLLATVERQHQELLRLQDCLLQVQSPHRHERLQRQTQKARRLFCALVQYSLHQQLAQADHLTLQPLPPLPDCQGTVMRLFMSPGGRWLATKLQPPGTHNRNLLRLYGWQEGAWHLQTLNPPNGLPPRTQGSVERCIFSLRQPDTLLCDYDGNQIASWHRNPDSGIWNHAPVLNVADSNKIESFFLSAEDDLVIRLRELGSPGQRMLVLHDRGSGRGWSTIVSNGYDRFQLLIHAPGWRQWATVTSASGAAPDTLAISIWERNLNAPSGICGFQETLLARGQHPLMLYYSPDACHLLGLMTGQRAVLWELDDKRRLQQKLEISCAFSEDYRDLSAQRLFHQSGKRLALPLSTHHIQFLVKHIRGHWFAGARLDIPPDAGDQTDDKMRYILWSSDGRTLVRVTRWQLDIWCQDSNNRWNRCARHTREDAYAPLLTALWLPPLNRHCLAALWREGRLWLYGSNRNGTSTQSACLANGAPVSYVFTSQDGLSVGVISGESRNLRLLQLATRTERDIASPAPVAADIMATAGTGTPAQVQDEEQDRPASQQEPGPAEEPAARPQDAAAAAVCSDGLANAGNLPDLVLYQIFNFLPV
ncbi:MAG: F-box-like domain-containing protein, partial [Kistimonas sp.]|nr:F-box-like domain-containing protein [Kistimonas sp.]